MGDAATFELAPAQHEDIPRLADIYAWALLLDPTFGFSYASEAECKMRMIVLLEGRIGDPTWQHIKVVNKSTGMPTAWAGWNTPNDAQIREYDESAAARIRNLKEATSEDDFDSLPGAQPSIQETTDRWLAKWTVGKRHILCKALFTDPSFQCQGMGSALIEYGNRMADQANLPIFFEASPFEYPLYAKHGFETVEHLDVDLAKFVPGDIDYDKGYGNYRLRYMVRLPRTLPETS